MGSYMLAWAVSCGVCMIHAAVNQDWDLVLGGVVVILIGIALVALIFLVGVPILIVTAAVSGLLIWLGLRIADRSQRKAIEAT